MIQVVAVGFDQISIPKSGFIAASPDLDAEQLRRLIDGIKQQESRKPTGIFTRLYYQKGRPTIEIVSPKVGERAGEDGPEVWGKAVGNIDEIIVSDSLTVVLDEDGNAEVALHHFRGCDVKVAAAGDVKVASSEFSVSLEVDEDRWLELLAISIYGGTGWQSVLNIVQLTEPSEEAFRPAIILAAALRNEIVLAAWPADIHRIEALFEGKAK